MQKRQTTVIDVKAISDWHTYGRNVARVLPQSLNIILLQMSKPKCSEKLHGSFTWPPAARLSA